MGILISAHQLAKSFGQQTLFRNISFAIEDGQKIGLIGPNGAGKSTLLKILAQKEISDDGTLSIGRGLRIAYLDQDPKPVKDESVYDYLYRQQQNPDDPGEIGYLYELISKLQLDSVEAGLDRKASELSGGWLKKLALAGVLLQRPHLLLLDEPTNHLDVDSIEWLEDFLSEESGLSYLMVTHDRLFLQRTCDWIFDLDPRNPKGLLQIKGNYADFLALKQAELDAQKKLEDVLRNQLRWETAWLRRGAKARQTKQSARIDRAYQLKDEVQELAEKNHELKLKFDLGDNIRNPKKIVELQSVTQKRGDKVLFKDFSFILSAKARVGILGRNGAGKTTLIETILGLLEPTEGKVKINDKVNFAVFDQKKNKLELTNTVLKNICPQGDYVHFQGRPIFARSYLSQFYFRADQMDMPAEKLSGGERTRLLIAQLLLRQEPVYILDEPTNDLDIVTMDTLQESLSKFPGALILVTHDRYFMDQVCNEILVITDDKNILKFSDLFQWEEWRRANERSKQEEKNKQSSGVKKNNQELNEVAVTENLKPKAKSKVSQKTLRDIQNLERQIQQKEIEINNLQSEIANPEVSGDYVLLRQKTDSLQQLQRSIQEDYDMWSKLSFEAGN